ncbi:YdeI/OmpD-associated family protein [Constantimarinum furrinae]|uniref:YdhG-like domain-containing protein n=1 Tax=Constantimarinum furrinae TaxID=2562285 RepID=A0A7G8PU63_9FLAO|nr:DUF1801 domain-containing protein [Constantimarinum furrinae]QNJ97879.1 hypothetical protein ALE3EI_1314 [Constantimarinum furrinae]
MNPEVDWFFEKDTPWQHEYQLLRSIILDCGLTETLKWGVPCYTFQNSNIVLIHGFKAYCALLFVKGALLKDGNKILVQQTKNVQSARQLRFTNSKEIKKLEAVIRSYIYEAIEVEKAGLEVAYKKTSEFEIPVEFQTKLEEIPDLKNAFEALTPGRKRGYLLYFSGAKQSKTRTSRVEKYMEHILNGKGLNDR